MELSKIAAKIIATIYTTTGIAVITGQLNFKDIAEDLKKSPALTYIAGSFGIIIGMILINVHNYWENNWVCPLRFHPHS